MTPDEMNKLIEILFCNTEAKTEEKEKTVVDNIPMNTLIPVKFIENEIVLQKLAAVALPGNRALGEILGEMMATITHKMIEHWEKCEDKIRWLK